MPLIVETGAVVADANTYVDLDTYQAYGADRGWTTPDDTSTLALVRAYDGLNRNWHYVGAKVDKLVQTGAFPRYIERDRLEYVVPSDSISLDIQNAQMELAHLIQEGLDPFETLEGVIKSAGAGPARVEFLGGSGRPRLVAVEGLLRPYLASGPGQTKMVRG